MRFFDQKLSFVLFIFAVPLLFLPKINLASLSSGESAGLRIDDIVLFFIGGLLMWSHIISHQRLYKVEGWLLLLTFFSIFSFISNHLLVSSLILHGDAKIFYSLRMMEYFIFFYIGAIASQFVKGHAIVKAFLLWNIAIMLLQKMNLLGAITVTGYATEASSRVFGIASFPSEMGLLLNLLFCYLAWDNSVKSHFLQLLPSYLSNLIGHFYLYFLFLVIGIFVIFTGNRISVVALIVCFICRLFQSFRFRSLGSLMIIVIAIPLLFFGMALLIRISEGIYERSASLLTMKNVELFQLVWQNVDISESNVNENSMGKGIFIEDYDLSWLIRIHKWLFLIKSFVSHPICYLQGLGPGFAGAALDGGILRIITEYGFIGVFLISKFFACIYRINNQTKWMLIAFLINMIFFDAYLAYKTMSFLFFTSGYIFETKNHVNIQALRPGIVSWDRASHSAQHSVLKDHVLKGGFR